MRNPFKTFAVLFSLSVFFVLSGCEEKSSREKFVDLLEKDIEAGHSFSFVTDKIMMGKYVTINDPYESVLDDYDFAAWDLENVQYEKNTINLVENIRARNCEMVWQILEELYPGFSSRDGELMGIFYQEGICLDQDPTKAAEIYTEILREGRKSPTVAARLGALYWDGRGVIQDRGLAEKYFQKAVVWMAPSFFSGSINDLFFDAEDTLDYKIWGLTVRQTDLNFVTQETGPWQLPEPLLEKILWLQSQQSTNGEEVFDLAHKVFKGEGGYDRDIETALSLLGNAGNYFNNHEAVYLSDFWRVDESICAERKVLEPLVDCEFEISFGIDFMESAAFDGNSQAITYLINNIQNHTDEEWTDWKLYQYLLLAKKQNLTYDSVVMDTAKNDLSPFEQQIIETWVEVYSQPISDYLPNGI